MLFSIRVSLEEVNCLNRILLELRRKRRATRRVGRSRPLGFDAVSRRFECGGEILCNAQPRVEGAAHHQVGYALRARRRFETIAQRGDFRVISDYAHHPTEIAALMTQATGLGHRRILAVFQPHRYSRTKAFAEGFAAALAAADELVLAPVYAASEPVVPGGRSADVFPVFQRVLGGRAQLAESLDDAWVRLRAAARPGDLFLVVGAGDVEELAFRARAELQSGGWPSM